MSGLSMDAFVAGLAVGAMLMMSLRSAFREFNRRADDAEERNRR